jgi:hypothetical protein
MNYKRIEKMFIIWIIIQASVVIVGLVKPELIEWLLKLASRY